MKIPILEKVQARIGENLLDLKSFEPGNYVLYRIMVRHDKSYFKNGAEYWGRKGLFVFKSEAKRWIELRQGGKTQMRGVIVEENYTVSKYSLHLHE